MEELIELKQNLEKKRLELLKYEILTYKTQYVLYGVILCYFPVPYILVPIPCIVYETYKRVKKNHNLIKEVKELEDRIKIHYVNCKHNYCKDKGYYLVKRAKKVTKNNKKIADLRKCTCVECGETIELFKTTNPNWDFTYNDVEINIEPSQQKRKTMFKQNKKSNS